MKVPLEHIENVQAVYVCTFDPCRNAPYAVMKEVSPKKIGANQEGENKIGTNKTSRKPMHTLEEEATKIP